MMTSPRSAADAPAVLEVAGPAPDTKRAPAAEWTREEFQEVVAPLIPRLYRLCLALSRNEALAEDLLQTSLVRAYVRRASFAGTGTFFGWLCQIARNAYSDHCRTEARRRTLFDAAKDYVEALTDSILPSETDPEEWICDSDSAAHLLQCLRGVPETYRVVLLLCDIEEMTHAQAAEALSLPIGTVKSRQMRGRRVLRKLYERHVAEGRPSDD